MSNHMGKFIPTPFTSSTEAFYLRGDVADHGILSIPIWN